MLAELGESELTRLLDSLSPGEAANGSGTTADHASADPEPARLRTELVRVRRQGFAVNRGRSERGVVAIGVAVRNLEDKAVAGLSIAMPSVRYDPQCLPALVATLMMAADGVRADLD
ncbi:IclR family transcriptional regulator C-terminal domain-containing protein [Rhodococcus sp. 4CII]|uniref:IclR family transcriptional regulator domain-containing protein n=1 Tax=Rhodococcus sp. 4CII TaxID=2834580 RepID=UPI0037CB83C7